MKIKIIIFCVIFSNILHGQDPNVTQYFFTPLYVNPSLAGYMEGNHRLSLNFRNQWKSILNNVSYKTAFASYDNRICTNDGNFWGFGINLLKDEAGVGQFQTNQANLNVAFHQKIDRNVYLSGGVQSGLVNYGFNNESLRFDEQFDGFDFDPTLPSMEPQERQNIYLFDISAGLSLYDIRKGYSIGLGLIHANQPSYSFFGNDRRNETRLNMRMVLHGAYTYNIDHRKSIIVKSLLMSQRPVIEWQHWQWQPGVEGTIRFGNYKDWSPKVILGLGARISDNNLEGRFIQMDAIAVSTRLHYSRLILGASYDINVSTLRKASTSRGGFEVSMSYQFSEAPDCVICVTF